MRPVRPGIRILVLRRVRVLSSNPDLGCDVPAARTHLSAEYSAEQVVHQVLRDGVAPGQRGELVQDQTCCDDRLSERVFRILGRQEAVEGSFALERRDVLGRVW